jgi:hypothetical protein
MPISGIPQLPFLCPAWPQGEHTKQAWTWFTPTLLLNGLSEYPPAKRRIEIDDPLPITVAFNHFAEDTFSRLQECVG